MQLALDGFDLGRLVDVRMASEGLFGQNLMLEVDGSRGPEEWVFRGAPHWPYQFSREHYFVEIVARMTDVAVPWPFHVVRDEKIFGWSYALMPRLVGRAPRQVKAEVDEKEWCNVARGIGAGLAEIHGATGADSGEYDPEKDAIAREPSYADWWAQSIERYRNDCLSIPGALDDQDIFYIEGLLADHRHALAVPFKPCVVHHDLNEGST